MSENRRADDDVKITVVYLPRVLLRAGEQLMAEKKERQIQASTPQGR